MMNSAQYLRCGTILAGAARGGRKIGVVTAKEKLRDIFSAGLFGVPPSGGAQLHRPSAPGAADTGPAEAGWPSAIAFSTEQAHQAKIQTHGIDNVEQMVGRPAPAIYSAEASLYVLWAGVALLEKGRP